VNKGRQQPLYEDFLSFQFTSRRLNAASKHVQGKRISNVTARPRLTCKKAFLTALQDTEIGTSVLNTMLLAEGPKEHEYRFVLVWEDFLIRVARTM
jgi:hypothetical protein